MREPLAILLIHLLEVIHSRKKHLDRAYISPSSITSQTYLQPQKPTNTCNGNLGDTYANPDNLPHFTSSGLHNGLHIPTALSRLLCDRSLDKFSVLICGELARYPDLAVGFDSLRVWCRRCLYDDC